MNPSLTIGVLETSPVAAEVDTKTHTHTETHTHTHTETHTQDQQEAGPELLRLVSGLERVCVLTCSCGVCGGAAIGVHLCQGTPKEREGTLGVAWAGDVCSQLPVRCLPVSVLYLSVCVCCTHAHAWTFSHLCLKTHPVFLGVVWRLAVQSNGVSLSLLEQSNPIVWGKYECQSLRYAVRMHTHCHSLNHTHSHLHTYVHASVHTYTYTCIHTLTHTSIHPHGPTYTLAHTFTFVVLTKS